MLVVYVVAARDELRRLSLKLPLTYYQYQIVQQHAFEYLGGRKEVEGKVNVK
jgi:hypothetical protein